MAASGCVEAKGSAGDLNTILAAKTLLQNGVFDHAFKFDQNSTKSSEQCVKRQRWNAVYRPTANKVDIVNLFPATPLTLHSKDEKKTQDSVFNCERRTLRIERAGSAESVVATSGGESCNSSSIASDSASEPSSPSRPVTPQPMPPVPAHFTDHYPFECLRADSEDSGLGPSPAKSSMGPQSPLEGYVSPIQFDPDEDERVDSLLDLTLSRGKNSFINCKETTDSFLPYTVSKLIAKEESSLRKRENGRSNDSFLFCLPRANPLHSSKCEDRSPPSVPTECEQQTSRNALDFQFLMTSKSVIGDTSCTAQGPTELSAPAVDPRSSNSSHRGLPTLSSISNSSSSLSSSSSVDKSGSATRSSSVTNVETNAKYSSANSNLSPRHKVDDAKANCRSRNVALNHGEFTATNTNNTSNNNNSSDVVVSSNNVDCDESRQSSCGDISQDRSDLCHDLISDCTSSSCSQVTNDTQSSNGIGIVPDDDNTCKWLNCDQKADANANSSHLVDHLRKCHVQSQFDEDRSYVCLWVGCKVYDRPSSSRSWLERHVLLHGGSKPFRCIVDSCHQRFGTEGALQRHVNSHFPQASKNGKAGPHGDHYTGGGPNGRHLKRKKHHKYRRRPHSVKTNDFFDDGIMEYVRHSLLELSSIEGMDRAGPPAVITFQSTVIARRTEGSGKIKLLLHWDPEDLLPDSWVSEEEAPSNFQKTIPISSLPPEALVHLDPIYAARLLPRPGKRRRK